MELVSNSQSSNFKCNKNFISIYAYLVEKLDDNINEDNYIEINDFLHSGDLRKLVEERKLFLVCNKGHQLIKYESYLRKCHFKHKNKDDVDYHPMTNWHSEWQSHFINTEVDIETNVFKPKRRADVLIGNKVIEIEHSYRAKGLKEITEKTKDLENVGKEVFWVVDGECYVEETNIKYRNTTILHFEIPQIYKNFIYLDNIYVDVHGFIYKINPKEVKGGFIETKNKVSKKRFIKWLKEGGEIWNNEKLPQCILYFNQRGAGSGKTYESIQLLQNEDKFNNKRLFIYLTKMHTAKDVIFDELDSQKKDGKLQILDFEECDDNVKGKQYKISYHNNKKDVDCQIIIGTIDSFMYHLGNKNEAKNDFFRGIVESIASGKINLFNNGGTLFAGGCVLNKNCLIIIDEGQDLNQIYVSAVCEIMRSTYIDTYIIGDKLQSIWFENNVFKFVEDNGIPNTHLIKNYGKNIVRRFHNNQFKNFVNKIIKFEKYGLKPIEGICDGKCKYEHEDNKDPIKLLEFPEFRNDDTDNEKVKKCVNYIIEKVELEVIENNYLPKNFMFIFPFFKGNVLAPMLESKLQQYWIDKFKDKKYQKNVLSKNEYWKDKINDNKYYKHAMIHKNEEGKSINLRESENSSRILSIHASKGNGCEVVFVLGITEDTLRIFSKDTGNLVYDSLLYVAITRQKKKLYFSVVRNGDDIDTRITEGREIEGEGEYEPKIDTITRYNIGRKISQHCLDRYFNELCNKCLNCQEEKECEFGNKCGNFNLEDYENLLPEDNEQKEIIDWGHHVIRRAILKYQVTFEIMNNEKIEEGKKLFDTAQMYATLKSISNDKVIKYVYEEYYKKRNEIINNNRNKEYDKNDFIPLLVFNSNDKSQYYQYGNILFEFVENIQKQIKLSLKCNKFPVLCPLETLILIHIIEIKQKGKYAEISMMDIYNIIDNYNHCSDLLNENHNYECLCKKSFVKKVSNKKFFKEIRESIINHYEKINKIRIVMNFLKNHFKEKINQEITFNIEHGIKIEINDFNIIIGKELIGNSKDFIFNFMLVPQLNRLNFYEVITRLLFENYIILNGSSEENQERFSGKKIINVLITMDSELPIIFEFKDYNYDNLLPFFKKYLYDKYSNFSRKVISYYNYWKNMKPRNKNSVEFVLEKITFIKEFYEKQGKVLPFPKYIINYFEDKNRNLLIYRKEPQTIKEIIEDINIENLNEFLYNYIYDIREEIDEEFDY